MDLGMHGYDHRDWHRVAIAEGVNPWACPFDCTDPPEWDDDEDGPSHYVSHVAVGTDGGFDFAAPVNWYPVEDLAQGKRFARTQVERTGRSSRIITAEAYERLLAVQQR